MYICIHVYMHSGTVSSGGTSSALSGCTPCPAGSYNSSPGNGVVCTIVSCISTPGYAGIPGACTCAAGFRYIYVLCTLILYIHFTVHAVYIYIHISLDISYII